MNPRLDNGSPCAACKKQRKKCTETCILAPYFPQSKSSSFAAVHDVFGTGNVIKMLERLPEDQRGLAAESMIFEAQQRLVDPRRGCTAIIEKLKMQVRELENLLAEHRARLQVAELAKAPAATTKTMASNESCVSLDSLSFDDSFSYNDAESFCEVMWQETEATVADTAMVEMDEPVLLWHHDVDAQLWNLP